MNRIHLLFLNRYLSGLMLIGLVGLSAQTVISASPSKLSNDAKQAHILTSLLPIKESSFDWQAVSLDARPDDKGGGGRRSGGTRVK